MADGELWELSCPNCDGSGFIVATDIPVEVIPEKPDPGDAEQVKGEGERYRTVRRKPRWKDSEGVERMECPDHFPTQIVRMKKITPAP